MKNSIKGNGILKKENNNLEILENKDFFYNIIVEKGPLGIAVTDIDFRFLKVNTTMCNLLGYSAEELLAMRIEDISHPDDYANDFYQFNLLLTGKISSYTMEKRFIKKDNSILFCRLTANLNKDINGKPIYAIGYIENITEQKKSLQKIYEIEERYKAIHNMSGELIYVFDLKGNFIEINEAAEKRLGFTSEELKNVNVRSLIVNEDDIKLLDNRLSELIKGNKITATESYKIKNKHGEFLEIESNVSLLHKNDKPYTFIGIARDVTERNRIYSELKNSKDLYKLLVENQTDFIVKVDPEGSFLYVSPNYCEFFGKSENELLGKKFFPFVHDDDIKNTRSAFQASLKPPFATYVEQRALTKFGWRWLAWAHKAVLDDSGKVIAVLGIGRDINDKKLAEIEVLKSEEKYRETINFLPVSVYEFDNKKNITFLNKKAKDLTGISDEEVFSANLNPLDYIVPSNVEYAGKNLESVLVKGELINGIEYKIRHKNGMETNVLANTAPIYNNGKIVGVRGAAIDISELKKIEEKLRESEERYRNLFEKNFSAVIVSDINGNIIECNQAFADMLGLANVNSAKKMNIKDLYENREYREKIEELLRSSGEIKNYEFRMKNIRGETKYIIGNAAVDYDDNGEIKTIRKYLTDNTEKELAQQKLENYKNHLETVVHKRTEQLKLELEKQKIAEEKIQKAFQKEKELNELKSSFISTASHEFRTPLTSIRLYTDLIAMMGKEINENELKNYIEHIQISVKNMTTLINDVLTLSRTDTGKISFTPSVIDLHKFSENILSEIKDICSSKHKLIFNYKTSINKFLLDEKLLRHIFLNLLSNAVKYSPNGGIVSLEINIDKNIILFIFSDEGLGIAENELNNIFEPFYRTSNSQAIEGTGLGLAIVKRSVELHGGTIEINSYLNKGTKFYVRLPIIDGK